MTMIKIIVQEKPFVIVLLTSNKMDDGLPCRPRSELERSSVHAALLASLDLHTAMHGYAATVAIVDFILPPLPPTPPPSPLRKAAPLPLVRSTSCALPAKIELKGPSWADLDSEEST